MCQENAEHLEQVYTDFEATQKEMFVWLDNAEAVLRELDQLKQDSDLSDDDVNKFKVNLLCCSAYSYSISLCRCCRVYHIDSAR